MTDATPADLHVSIDGAVQGPLDDVSARALAAEQLASGRRVLVWRPGWSAWVHPWQVWPPARGAGTGAGMAAAARPGANTKRRAAIVLGSLAMLVCAAIAIGVVYAPPESVEATKSSPASRTPSPCEQFATCVCGLPEVAERRMKYMTPPSELNEFARRELDRMCKTANAAARAESAVAGDLTCAGAFDHLADERNGTIIARMLREDLLLGLPDACEVTVRGIDVEDDLAAAAEAKVLDRDPVHLSEANLPWSPMDPVERLELLLDLEAEPEKIFPELAKEIRQARDEFARRDVHEKRVPAYVEARQEILGVLAAASRLVELDIVGRQDGEYDFEGEAYWMLVDDFPPVAMSLRSPRMREDGHLLAWPVKPEPARALKAELRKLERVQVAFTVVPVLGSVRPLGYRFCTDASSSSRACSEWVAWLPGVNSRCPDGGCVGGR